LAGVCARANVATESATATADAVIIVRRAIIPIVKARRNQLIRRGPQNVDPSHPHNLKSRINVNHVAGDAASQIAP
jgi:hypothetical protein